MESEKNADKKSTKKAPSKQMQKFLQEPVKSPNKILFEHYRSQTKLEQKQAMAATGKFRTTFSVLSEPASQGATGKQQQMPSSDHVSTEQLTVGEACEVRESGRHEEQGCRSTSSSPLRNTTILDKLAKYQELALNPKPPKLLNSKNKITAPSKNLTVSKPKATVDWNGDVIGIVGHGQGHRRLPGSSKPKASVSGNQQNARKSVDNPEFQSSASKAPNATLIAAQSQVFEGASCHMPTGRGYVTTQMSTEEKDESRFKNSSRVEHESLPNIVSHFRPQSSTLTGLNDTTVVLEKDLSKSQVFNTNERSASALFSRKNSSLVIDRSKESQTHLQDQSSQQALKNLQRASELLQASNQHQKSLKLLQYLEKRTEKRSRSLQQRMVDAMDRSIKQGPLKYPRKLIRQLQKAESQKKIFATQKRQVQEDLKRDKQALSSADDSCFLDRWGTSNVSKSENSLLPDLMGDLQQSPIKKSAMADTSHENRADDLPPRHKRKEKQALGGSAKKPVQIVPSRASIDLQQQQQSTQEQVFDTFIPQILAHSINLKLRDDYNERQAEYAAVLKVNKAKAQMKAKIAVSKLLSQDDYSIDDVLQHHSKPPDTSPRKAKNAEGLTNDGLKSKGEAGLRMDKSEIYIKTVELSKAYKAVKSFEVGLRDQSCAEIANSQNARALQRLKTRLEKQRSLLQEADLLTEQDNALIELILKEEVAMKKPALNRKKIEEAAAELLSQKFQSIADRESSAEVKTLKLLIDEVIKQIRCWSCRHADLLTNLMQRSEALKQKNFKQVKQVAHLVKDKLTNAVAKLQSRLQEVDYALQLKVATLDLALKSQDQSEANFEKAMNLFHFGNTTKNGAEEQLKELKQRVAVWMPNFTKYESSPRFVSGLKQITPKTPLDDKQLSCLWDTMKSRIRYNEDADMWGFQEDETPMNLFYQNEPLAAKYKRDELWLRSDLSRLTQIFNVGIPSDIKLERATSEITKLKHEKLKQERVIKNYQMELSMRNDLLKKTQEKVFETEAELARLQEMEHWIEKYRTPKADVATQVQLLNESLNTVVPTRTAQLLAQEKKITKREASLRKMMRNNTVQIDLGLPSMAKMNSDKNQIGKQHQQGESIDPAQARKKLEKLLDIDLFNVYQPLSQTQLRKMRHRKISAHNLAQFQPQFIILNQFMSAAMGNYPFVHGTSAWHVYQQTLQENSVELMQGLQDLEQMGNEDWRFAVVQSMCGIHFNKTNARGVDIENADIRQAFIDKRDSTVVGFVISLFETLSGQMDIINFFSQSLPFEEEFLVDLDLLLVSLANSAKWQERGNKQIKKTIVPQLLSIMYEKLTEAVGKVECYLQESSTHERMLMSVIYDDLETSQEVLEVKFLFDIVFALHRAGLGELEYCDENEEIQYETLVQFIESHLKLEIPDQLKDEDVMDIFIAKRVLSLRRAKKNDDRIQRITPADMNLLQRIYIKQYLTMKDAFVGAVHAGETLIKLRQLIFEPIYTHYKGSDGYLDLTGSFYQCLLFISKCNVATSFIDAVAQHKAYDRINKRTRKLINTLRNQQQFKKISLSKFTDVCIDIGLTSQVAGALRKIGKHLILVPSESLSKIRDSIERIDAVKSELNILFHAEIREQLKRPQSITAIYETQQRLGQLLTPVRHCVVKLINSTEYKKVFNVIDSNLMRPGFDVLIDCGLAELAMTIDASTRKASKKNKNKSRRFTLRKLISMSQPKRRLRSLEFDNDDHGGEDEERMPVAQKLEIAIQTDENFEFVNYAQTMADSLAYDDTVHIFQQSIDKDRANQQQARDMNWESQGRQHVVSETIAEGEITMTTSKGIMIQDQQQSRGDESVRQKRGSSADLLHVRQQTNTTIKEAQEESETHWSQNQKAIKDQLMHVNSQSFADENLFTMLPQLALITPSKAGRNETNLTPLSSKKSVNNHLIEGKVEATQDGVSQTTLGLQSDSNRSKHMNDDAAPLVLPAAAGEEAQVSDGRVEVFKSKAGGQTVLKSKAASSAIKIETKNQSSQRSSAQRISQSPTHGQFAMIVDPPTIHVSVQKSKYVSPSHSLSSMVLSQSAFWRGQNGTREPHDFSVVKPDIVTGENKWREEVQRHKERMEEARMTQQARFTSMLERSGQHRRDREALLEAQDKKNIKLKRTLNQDLTLIDDKSDFTGSFLVSADNNLNDLSAQAIGHEQNRKFIGKTLLNQLNMNGEEPKFAVAGSGSPLNNRRQISPQRTQLQEYSISGKGQKTLKLLKSFKDGQSSTAHLDETGKQQTPMKNVGFESVIAESGGFELYAREQLTAGFEPADLKTKTTAKQRQVVKNIERDQDESSYLSDGTDSFEHLGNEKNVEMPSEEIHPKPVLSIQKITMVEKPQVMQVQYRKMKKQGQQDEYMRMQSAVTLSARYPAPDEDSNDAEPSQRKSQ